MKNELIFSALIQPKDKGYKEKGIDREVHLEIRDDDFSYCLRTGGQTLVVIKCPENNN